MSGPSRSSPYICTTESIERREKCYTSIATVAALDRSLHGNRIRTTRSYSLSVPAVDYGYQLLTILSGEVCPRLGRSGYLDSTLRRVGSVFLDPEGGDGSSRPRFTRGITGSHLIPVDQRAVRRRRADQALLDAML